MSVRAAADQTYHELKKALAAGKLPNNVADTAVKLLDRLNKPVRLSLMGLPGSGKSTVANLLLNQIVLPDGINLPTTQFVHGETPQAICTLPDGSKQRVDGADPHDIASLDPMFVEFQLPLPALGRISVLEVVAPETPREQQRAMFWAAKRTDMAIWCTQTFSSTEQALWETLPDTVKDHAFMLVTRADHISQNGDLDTLLNEIRYASAHQFNKIMPIATTDAIAARRADGSVDKPLLQKSGGLTLISSILRQVDMGLQSTVDQAEMILHKFRNATANPAAARDVDAEKVEDPAEVTSAATLVTDATPVVDVDTSEPVIAPRPGAKVIKGARKAEPVETMETVFNTDDAFVMRSRPIDAAKAPMIDALDTAAPEEPKKPRAGFMPKARSAAIIPRAKPETCSAYSEAVTYLTKQGRNLTKQLADDTDIGSDELMAASAENIMWLSDYLDDVKVDGDPVLEKTRSRALDAAELIQLMQLEKNENAGIEALSLVVQLKRDLEAEIALSKASKHIRAA